MGNYCNPYDTVADLNTEKKGKVLGARQTEVPAENQVDRLEFGNSGKFDKVAPTRNLDQKNKKCVQQQGNGEIVVEQTQTKPVDTLKPVDEQKEILISSGSQDSVGSSASSVILQENAKNAKQQQVNKDTEEEIIIMKYSPQKENSVDVQNKTKSCDFKTTAEIKDTRPNDEVETNSLKNDLLAERKTAVQHNKRTAVKKCSQEISSRGDRVDTDENVKQQLQLNEEDEVHRLENEILEKRKVVDKQNETLTRLSEQKEERVKDLKNLEYRVATIKLQSELKERAYIIASEGHNESTTVTLIEGRLFKFGRGGMTHPKEKWVQLRRYPKGQVVLDYAELFFSEKYERNQITHVERGERYLGGNASLYSGRVFAVRTTSTGKHKHMVFATDSEGLCEKWVEIIKLAFE